MQIDIVSLFPEYFAGPFDESMIKRARNNGILDIRHTNIRDYADNKHNRVDDRPYGGGPGMVLMAKPVVEAVRSVKTPESTVIYLSPQGKTLTPAMARELSTKEHLVFLCGHYEGIDERALGAIVDEEISIGDYVVTSGCPAAIVVIDAMARYIPGFLGDEDSAEEDSFENGILDCPHYTRPPEFEGNNVPEVLLSGNHKDIEKWRHEEALKKTKTVRPDLTEKR
ncbi:MAG: tRNA (guanosine(37)-N1)-methyltransferase TrmD [Waddliaceae bacterium]|jgi:tRNA (guanine37-N1)-methyltransferase|nr:tRNA (guanosine(37)-N1)-methyltransferase TrmD [Waddliaceae bacterium]MBT3579186.1 tRNA (guanosine(37)-N1)-methyltransferase TrmD [Waddliaceae bacterium]MBT4444754.1 tRNA (guanosine(37)-N1)-methyltransferase TrmD [Waddliaceae bacterium]MBT6928886.1 tRNA (guanosine(37)-N1)-methyltransferase TrmD [Waddliaceae bacterium]MBT7264134.1 tRNA (guanosine(37)-N1)-methyltransferase TrmD [Waddliaceae bacterium]